MLDTCLACISICIVLVSLTQAGPSTQDQSFIRTTINEGVQETRLLWNGIHAMETVIAGVGQDGLFLREATNGLQIVHSIYSRREVLIDCDVTHDVKDLERFWRRFEDHNGSGLQNISSYVYNGFLDYQYSDLADMHSLKIDCNRLHRQLKHTHRPKMMLMRQYREHGVVADDIGADYIDDDNSVNEPVQREIRNNNTTNNRFGQSQQKGPAVRGPNDPSTRVKRQMLIYPGTFWCGTGNTAPAYHNLGANAETDKCCRSHDHCPHLIEGFAFSAKFNLFNYRFHTLSHCRCDEVFRGCLQRLSDSGNPEAQMVLNLFFKVVGTKCFRLRPEQICATRSWWGTCDRYKKELKAYIIDIDEPRQPAPAHPGQTP